MFCKKCGTQMNEGVKFCPTCGQSMDQPQSQTSQQQQPPPQQQTTPQQQPPLQQQPPPQSQPISQTTIRQDSTIPNSEFRIPNSPSQPQPPPQSQPMTQTTIRQDSTIPNSEFRIPNSPAPSAKKKLPIRMIAIITAIVIVLAGGGTGVYFLLRSNKDTPPVAPTDDLAVSDTTGIDGANDAETTGDTGSADIVDITDNSGDTVDGQDELPSVSYSYIDKKPEAVIEFTTVESVFPTNYRSMESLVVFTGYSDYGELDVLIEVEMPGFTQPHRQKVTLGRQVTKLRILPPLVTETLDLSSEKAAQLVYSVTEVDSGKLLVQESKSVKLYSKFDMVWGDFTADEAQKWYAYADNMLAWLTPDAPEILSLKRDAIDYLSYISDGDLDGLYGYQNYNYFESYYSNTWVQAVAIQGAMSDIVQVRYNNSGFSMDAQQRVKLPADTLNSRSGICIETAMVMASALQSAGMNVMLVLPPGHAQVAVEAWPNTGDYYLIETTVLPMPLDNNTWNYVVQYMSKDEWWSYLSGESGRTYGPCYVVDCALGEKLGIRPMTN